MTKSLYVGNLPHSCDEQELRTSIEAQGVTPEAVTVVLDLRTGRSRGFGFVEMPDSSEANKAIEELNGFEHEGRALTVNEARPRR